MASIRSISALSSVFSSPLARKDSPSFLGNPAANVQQRSSSLRRQSFGRKTREIPLVSAVATAPGSKETSADTADELVSWLKSNGMPDNKVVLKDRPTDSVDEPMHYVAAKEDLQVRQEKL